MNKFLALVLSALKDWLSYRRQLTPVPSLVSVNIHLILPGKIILGNESYRAAHTGSLSCLCNHSLDITRKNHTGERVIQGGPRSTRGFHCFGWSSFISVQSRATVSCTRKMKSLLLVQKSASPWTGSGYPCVIFVNPRWCPHVGHGLVGGTCKRVQHPLL